MAEEVTSVPALARERLPYHPALEERFGVDRSAWRALVEAVFPNAESSEAVIMALGYCRARRLDIFKRPVHIVPMWSSKANKYIETVWPGIGELRTTAARTGEYAGNDDVVYGEDVDGEFQGTTGRGDNQRAIKAAVTYPKFAQMTVYRMVKGQRVQFVGPKVHWLETYSKIGKSEVPNDRWQRSPRQMIEKCAEAAALRRAFPEELGSDYTAEEMEGKDLDNNGHSIETTATPANGKSRSDSLAEKLRERGTPAQEPANGNEPVTVEPVVEQAPPDSDDANDELADMPADLRGDANEDAPTQEARGARGRGKQGTLV